MHSIQWSKLILPFEFMKRRIAQHIRKASAVVSQHFILNAVRQTYLVLVKKIYHFIAYKKFLKRTRCLTDSYVRVHTFKKCLLLRPGQKKGGVKFYKKPSEIFFRVLTRPLSHQQIKFDVALQLCKRSRWTLAELRLLTSEMHSFLLSFLATLASPTRLSNSRSFAHRCAVTKGLTTHTRCKASARDFLDAAPRPLSKEKRASSHAPFLSMGRGPDDASRSHALLAVHPQSTAYVVRDVT